MSNETIDSRIKCDHQQHAHKDESLGPVNGEGTPAPLALVPLKTVLELRAENAVTDVYITAVPVKSANSVLAALRPLLNDAVTVDLQHLRRFVKHGDVPQALGARFAVDSAKDALVTDLRYLMVGPVSSVALEALETTLCATLALPDGGKAPVWTTAVPLLAPTSQPQATQWTASHWPTIYKKHNPFGPHPSIVSRAEDEMYTGLDNCMAMAHRVASDAASSSLGEAIGAVVISRSGGSPRAIALAGDARWAGGRESTNGNVMAHAVLRAIGMVALRLKAAENQAACTAATMLDGIESDFFLDKPVLAEERVVFEGETLPAGGYLCHNLEIYLTHEPCVMCSMALLHSRFGRVVFGERMPQTGGLCGELNTSTTIPVDDSDPAGLGHGLFWRKELNWSLLAWEAPEAPSASKPAGRYEVKPSVQA